jgi:methylmalonyl-CoA mutase N-terminal domain/subunit
MMLKYHVQTDGFNLTKQQPLNNIVRVTIQALAAVMGGCQSLHTNSYDEALALPSKKAVQVALRTQQIIAHESGVADTVDPLGGSYYLEWLTNQIENQAMEYITEIDKMGGAIKAIDLGYIQREVASSSYQFQKMVESGEHVVVGVNKFTGKDEGEEDAGDSEPEDLQIGIEIEMKQVERVRRLRLERDNQKVNQMLGRVRAVAKSDDNIMPALIDAVKAYATIGEISDVLRNVYGEYRVPNVL